MYRIIRSDGTVLYDQSQLGRQLILKPQSTMEVGQAGQMQFVILPGHPQYNSIENMATYLSVEDDGEEVFYGRVIDISVNKINGNATIQCAGALSFLDDSELAPIPEGSETMTGEAFFRLCINTYNSDVNDSKRTLTVGIIDHAKASVSRKFGISSYTQIKSALESNLLNDYGGYLKIRKYNGVRYIDWVDEFDESDASPIQLAVNIISQDNAITANELFTVLRPTGKSGIGLPEVTIPVSQELVNKYGRIVRSVGFNNAETESDLRSEAYAFIDKMGKGPGKTGTIKLIDMHYLDGTIPKVRLGAVYTNIAGFENEEMVVAGITRDFCEPKNDSITLKNAVELLGSMNGSATGSAGRGAISKTSGPNVFRNLYNHITETEKSLSIHADLIELHGKEIVETALQFERFSTETNTRLGTVEGTGVMQNNDIIVQAAGQFSSRYRLVPKPYKEGTKPRERGYYIADSYKATEDDINTGIELYGSIAEALMGNVVPTKTLEVGHFYIRMVPTSDETVPTPAPQYYTKSLGVTAGTEVYLDDEGQEVNVVKSIHTVSNEVQDVQITVDTIEGSALWTKRDDITGVVGEFEIHDEGGVRTLVIKSGGGLKIERNGTEFGVFDNDNLTGGIIAQKINGQDSQTKVQILGTMVDINATQVKVGSTSNVSAWMTSTGNDIDELEGLVADRATIAQLNAQTARIDSIETDYLQTVNLGSQIANITTLTVQGLNVTGDLYVRTGQYSQNVTSAIWDLDIHDNGDNTYTLRRRRMSDSGWVDVGTFSRATSVTLSGSWSGTTLTVTAVETGDTYSTSISLNLTGSANFIGANVKNGNTTLDSKGAQLVENVNDKKVYCQLTGGSQTTIGQVSTQDTFDAGSSAGYASAHLSGTWGGTNNNEYTVSKVTTGSQDSITLTVTAGATIVYSSTTHKYTATGSAKVNGTERNSATSVSGTEAYEDGESAGYASAHLSGTWGGTNNNEYTVSKVTTGSQDSITLTVTAGATIVYSSTTHKYTATGSAKVNGTERNSATSVSGTEAYEDGVTAGEGKFSLASITLQGSAISGVVYHTVSSGGVTYYTAGADVTYYKGDGGTVTVQGNPAGTCYPVVTSEGTVYYTAGSSYTVQGTPAGTCYPVVTSGGTVYYTAGTKYTVQGSSAGTCYPVVASGGTVYYTAGSSYTVQGTAGPKLKHWGYGLLFRNVNGTYVPVVEANWYHDHNGTTQYYNAGTSSVTAVGSTSIRLGSSGVKYNAGTSTVTAISSTSVRLGTSGLKYNAGTSTVTAISSTSIRLGTPGLKYDAGTITAETRGDSVTVTPIGGTSLMLTPVVNGGYNEGSTVTDTYYTKS